MANTLKIIVNQATYNTLAGAAQEMGGRLVGGRRMPNNMWQIELSEPIWRMILATSLPGESVDDVIARVAADRKKGFN